jgi:hypothetical protein
MGSPVSNKKTVDITFIIDSNVFRDTLILNDRIVLKLWNICSTLL